MSWQIGLIGITTRTTMVTVAENCTGAQLFQALKKLPDVPKGYEIMLRTSDSVEIEDTSSKCLRDFGMANKSCLQVTMRVIGGNWPTVKELEASPRHLRANQQIRITTSSSHPDVCNIDNESTRAIMPCGHAVAPLSLALYCHYELDTGKDEIICPGVNCNAVWKFREIRVAACLSDDEVLAFESRIIENRITKNPQQIKKCPKCDVYCTRFDEGNNRVICPGCSAKNWWWNYEFCWVCMKEWKLRGTMQCGNEKCSFIDHEIVKRLTTCGEKYLDGKWCPTLRACPKCYAVIEHVKSCKCVKCPRCQYYFCFVCLEKSVFGLFCTSRKCCTAPRQID